MHVHAPVHQLLSEWYTKFKEIKMILKVIVFHFEVREWLVAAKKNEAQTCLAW